jgi:hypothetical protein
MSRRAVVAATALLAALSVWAAVPFWGAKESSTVGTLPADLKPGEWIWDGDAAPDGPIAVVVSITEQRAYAYRNGLLIGVSTVSTGKPGHETPTGVFTILQKDANHHSNLYNNAPMPYQERLTVDGVALHAGGLPGYPESHGCVHLPTEFAKELFGASHMGMTVVIGAQGKSPVDIAHPPAFMPIDAKTGADDEQPRLADTEEYRWQPNRSPDGRVSILLSGADKRILVFRNGVEIGRSRLQVRDSDKPLGTHVYIIKEGAIPGANPTLPGTPIPNWTAINVPGTSAEAGQPLSIAAMERVVIPPAFASAVYPLLKPGVTLLVTDAAVLGTTTGATQRVLDAEPPAV